MLVWCRRKQQKRGPGEKPEVAAPKWSPIPTTTVTWIPVSEPRGKLSSDHLSGVGFGWYLARISLQLVPACWCSYPLVVRRDFAFFPCVFCVCSLRFFDLNFPQRVCSFQAPSWFCIFTFEVFLFRSCFSAYFFIIRGVIGIFLFYWWGLCSFFVFFVGGNGLLTGQVRLASYSPMSVHGKTVCLSTVSEEDLTSSLGALSTGGTIPPPHDFVDRFCRKRANYFRTKNVGIIADPDDFLRGFQPGDIAIYKDFIRQEHWAGSFRPPFHPILRRPYRQL